MKKKLWFAVLALILASSIKAETKAQVQTMCVFDVAGTQGDIYAFMKDYSITSRQWGANIVLRVYVDERVAFEDFKANQCDGVVLTGIRNRQLNNFAGSIDAIGAVPSNASAKLILTLMANAKLAPDMQSKGYEVVGVASLGSAYMMARNRKIDSLAKSAGIKFGVLDYDKAQAYMVEKIGGQPISSDLTNIGAKFNNGQIDTLGMPALAFRPLELAKGMGTKGGIFRFPVVHVTYQITIRPDKFPSDYGQKSRTWVASQLSRQFESTRKIERGIDPRYWADLSANDKLGYIKLMREVRMELTRQGLYNQKMMSLLKKVRCLQDPASFECSLKGE